MKLPTFKRTSAMDSPAGVRAKAIGERPRLRVAMFTPLPPARTGTADYAAELVPALEECVDLRVLECHPRGFRKESFDCVVYQIGNNPYHLDIYKLALRQPGVVVLHEANVHHLIQALTLRAGHPEAYVEELVYELYGAKTESLMQADAPPAVETLESEEFTMIRRLVDASQAFIVHSHWAAWLLRVKGFGGPVCVIPHGVAVRPVQREKYRDRLGLRPGEFLVGAFGYQRPCKHETLALRAFRNLRHSGVAAKFLTVGEDHPDVAILDAAKSIGVDQDVIRLDHVAMEEFEGYISACDVVVNLRSPTYGEASGVMSRAFAAGRAVVVSATGAFAEAPGDICLQIDLDDYAEDVLTECFKRLADDEELRHAIGDNAREWVHENCSWGRVASQYEEFLRELIEGSGSDPAEAEDDRLHYVAGWIKQTEFDRQYFECHAARFERLLSLTPPGRPEGRLLELGCYMQITPAFQRLLGYGDVRGAYLGRTGSHQIKRAVSQSGDQFICRIDTFDAEQDVFPYDSSALDCIVCSELLEHLKRDPMHMLFEINRILKPGGALVLSTPNAVSFDALGAALFGRHPSFYSAFPADAEKAGDRHNREYTPDEVQLLLTDAGFSVQRIETGPYGRNDPAPPEWVKQILIEHHLPATLRDRCIFAVAVKRGEPRTRYPSWLYDGAGTSDMPTGPSPPHSASLPRHAH